jgi:hypothetical protein
MQYAYFINTFLVVTNYERHSNEGAAAMEVFRQWKHLPLGGEPYMVFITADLTLEQLIENVRSRRIECEVTELGKTQIVNIPAIK